MMVDLVQALVLALYAQKQMDQEKKDEEMEHAKLKCEDIKAVLRQVRVRQHAVSCAGKLR